ncbi:MAG: double-strand break repair protein AddB [Sphingomicrobium sp.]
MAEAASRPAIFTIPSHRAFADSLTAGLIERFGRSPLGLAEGRILLPNNRAVRTMTEAFVRLSGGRLLLPRLIPIGDPDLGERIGGALEPPGDDEPPPAIDPAERTLALAGFLTASTRNSAEALRLAAELARTLDALGIEEIDARDLREAIDRTEPGAEHWEKSLKQLEAILTHWPALLAAGGAIDLVERRNLLLRRLARRWTDQPPAGFTVAAGITTAAPAVANLLATVATMQSGEVVLPGLWLDDVMPDAEWDRLGVDGEGPDEPAHPQYHLKFLLSRMGLRRSDVAVWRKSAGPESPGKRAIAVANALAAPAFSSKWASLSPAQRRFDGVRLGEFPDPAAEAQGIALAMREAIETPGRTAALVTPDRGLAERVSALLARWGIEADDSAGRTLSRTPPGTFMLALAALAAEDFAPVPLLAALKHPLAGGSDEARRLWLDDVRAVDLKLRGPRPAAGLAGLDQALAGTRAEKPWSRLRPAIAALDGLFAEPVPLSDLAARLSDAAQIVSHGRAWTGQAGRLAAEMLAELGASRAAAALPVAAEDAVAMLRQILDSGTVRPPYGGHPRLFIWGVLEARLQRADLMILGGLNEGTWPAAPSPDPFLPPRVRSNLEMPTLETRIGLAAHDFAFALGAPEVLITRAKRDSRSPTVASRFWLRLKAIDPDIAIDDALPALAFALDDPAEVRPADRPEPRPEPGQRPREIRVTDVDLLRADPYSFYAKRILGLFALEAVDADPSAAWKGTSVHQVLEHWLKEDGCAPDALLPRIAAMLADPAVHPLVRSLWRSRIEAAATWVVAQVSADRGDKRVPRFAEADGRAAIAGIDLFGKADRIDTLAGGGIAIVDYKTGHAPENGVIDGGYALQLGLLALLAREDGFKTGRANVASIEYWSLAKDRKRRTFGYRQDGAGLLDTPAFLAMTERIFAEAAARWLTGTDVFKAKLVPEHSKYGDYDQLMRLEEWYARL